MIRPTLRTLRLAGGRDAPSTASDPTHDATDHFPSVLSPELLGELLGSVPEEVAADALAALAPQVLARIVDKALMQKILRLDAKEHLENAVLVARALGQLCDRLARRPAPRRPT